MDLVHLIYGVIGFRRFEFVEVRLCVVGLVYCTGVVSTVSVDPILSVDGIVCLLVCTLDSVRVHRRNSDRSSLS